MTAYYNEIEPYAAQWLRSLMVSGHIAWGDVDERSITEVSPDDLKGYTQCHFFAGIGVWSHALRRAGWEDDRPIWTGSCPCQPFSAAGKQEGFNDERHLWPVWFNLIRQCRPAIVIGEQVSGGVALGKDRGVGVRALWERKATLAILENRIKRELAKCLQGVPERSGEGLAFGTPLRHINAGEQTGGRREGPFGRQDASVRPYDGVVAGEAGRGCLRGDGHTFRHGSEEGLERAFSGSDSAGGGVHAGEHAGCAVRAEHGLRSLGGETIDRDRVDALEQAAREIRYAAIRTDLAIEREGQSWLATVQTDMEGAGYAFGAADLCAAGFDGAHIRQRLYFAGIEGMDDAASARRFGSVDGTEGDARHEARLRLPCAGSGHGGMADGIEPGLEGHAGDGDGSREPGRLDAGQDRSVAAQGAVGGVGNAGGKPGERGAGSLPGAETQGDRAGRADGRRDHRHTDAGEVGPAHAPMLGRTPVDWLFCRDGKWRPVGPGTFPLVDAAPARVGRLRAYGNGLDAETATQFIGAVMECL